MDHHAAASRHLSSQTVLENARRLGLKSGRDIVAESGDEMTLILDLGLYTAGKGRSRGIDRYARSAAFPPESDESFVLQAMCAARFGLWRVEGRHETVGVIVCDLTDESSEHIWLVDEGLEKSARAGFTFAARLAGLGDFAMHSGIAVPLERAMLEEALDAIPDPEKLGGDWPEHPRFIGKIYRIALELRYFATSEEEELDREGAATTVTVPRGLT